MSELLCLRGKAMDDLLCGYWDGSLTGRSYFVAAGEDGVPIVCGECIADVKAKIPSGCDAKVRAVDRLTFEWAVWEASHEFEGERSDHERLHVSELHGGWKVDAGEGGEVSHEIGIGMFERADGTAGIRLGLPSTYCQDAWIDGVEERFANVAGTVIEGRVACDVREVHVAPGCIELSVEYHDRDVSKPGWLEEDLTWCRDVMCELLEGLDIEFPNGREGFAGEVRDRFDAARILVQQGIHDSVAGEHFIASAVARGDQRAAALGDVWMCGLSIDPQVIGVRVQDGLGVLGAGFGRYSALANMVDRIGVGSGRFPVHVKDGSVPESWGGIVGLGPFTGLADIEKLVWPATRGLVENVTEHGGMPAIAEVIGVGRERMACVPGGLLKRHDVGRGRD